MSKVTDALNRIVIGLGLAMLLAAGADAAPVVSYSPAGISASDGCKSKSLSSYRSSYNSSSSSPSRLLNTIIIQLVL
jgi:hypothetical protein